MVLEAMFDIFIFNYLDFSFLFLTERLCHRKSIEINKQQLNAKTLIPTEVSLFSF